MGDTRQNVCSFSCTRCYCCCLCKRTSYNEAHRQTIQVKKIYENAFPGGTMFMTKDIALLKLSKPFKLDDYVQTIPMAEAGEDFTGQTCVLTGWGRYNTKNNNLANTLQELATKAITKEACQGPFKSWGATACHGDSGGPAVCKRDGKFVLAGVTSGGSPYCTPGYPNIYTKIASYRDWIKSKSGL